MLKACTGQCSGHVERKCWACGQLATVQDSKSVHSVARGAASLLLALFATTAHAFTPSLARHTLGARARRRLSITSNSPSDEEFYAPAEEEYTPTEDFDGSLAAIY